MAGNKNAGRKAGLRATVGQDAEKMQFNPLEMERTDMALWREYPEIKDVCEEYVKGSSNDTFKIRAVNYMVWLYSRDTVLNTKPVDPLKDRKYKAAGLAGFKMDASTNAFPDRVIKELFDLEDEKFINMVLIYLKDVQHNELFSEIIVSEEQHHEAMRLRMTPVTGDSKKRMEAADVKKKLRLECKELMQDIKQYWDEFWEDHIDLKAVGQMKLYKSIEDRARINVGI